MHKAQRHSPVYVLIHSPLVGPTTWSEVARLLKHRGHQLIVPALIDSAETRVPYWQQHAESVARALCVLPADQSVILVAHSGAGILLPAISDMIRQPIAAYIFVDAGVPTETTSRLDAIRSEDPYQASAFQRTLDSGERYPMWTEEVLAPLIPNADLRRHFITEIHPRGMDFFTETIPVSENWMAAPCGYLYFTEHYAQHAGLARRRGWHVREFDHAGHFHMLAEPAAVADALEELVEEMLGE